MGKKKAEKEISTEPQAWAYLRVSTEDQDVNNQKLEILRLANEKGLGAVTFIEETASGRKSWRERRTAELLDRMKPGDSLLVAELSRLGRSMLEIMEILHLATERDLRVFAAKGGWSLDGSLPSKIVAMVLAMAAEIEKELISQRTKAALATRKAAGVTLGRPKGPGASKLDKHEAEIRELITLGVPITKIAPKFSSSVPNLRAWLKKRKA